MVSHNENDTRRELRKTKIFNVFREFNENTTLHGLKYLTERDLTIFERVFWLVMFLISLVLCCWLMNNVWWKWQDTPIIISFHEKLVPVWQVPFPSVTICPQMKARASVYNYTEKKNIYKYRYATQSTYDPELEKLDNVALVCENRYYLKREICNHTIVKDIREVSPRINDVFYSCRWRTNVYKCDDIFREVMTSEGICYNFNGLSGDEIFRKNSVQTNYKYIFNENRTKGWSLEEGYTTKTDANTYPIRGRENDATPDLSLILKEYMPDLDKYCNRYYDGFKIYLHHPVDMPRSIAHHYSVLHDETTSLAVNFEMITTSENLENYSPQTRQCYFPSDRKLRYFQNYTENNCEQECISNYTFKKCGCVWYDMPHDNSEQLCCNRNRACVNAAKEELADREMELEVQAAAGNVSEEGCFCLPPCDYVHYEAEVLKSDFNIKRLYDDFYKEFGGANKNFFQLHVYFKNSQFASFSRSELFGLTDFLANCGGLLGLFLGFSFLSVVEILYYSSLRLYCIVRRERRTYNLSKINENKG